MLDDVVAADMRAHTAPVTTPFDEALKKGAILFDGRLYFEAHEAWEDLWRIERDPTRRLVYQALIQFSAAFLKLVEKDRPAPAMNLFGKALEKLDRCPDVVDEVDVATFREGCRACRAALADARFEVSMIPAAATLARRSAVTSA